MRERIPLCDEQDTLIGFGPKWQASLPGRWRRLVYVLLNDGEGSILLQRRAGRQHRGKLTATASGHVNQDDYPPELLPGIVGREDGPIRRLAYDQGAMRELYEEAGVEGICLSPVGQFGGQKGPYRAHARAYQGIIARDTLLTPNPHEVAEMVWRPQETVVQEAGEGSAAYTLGFRALLRQLYA